MDNVKIMTDNKLEARFNSSEIKENNGRFDYTLKGTNEWQYVEVIAADVAGNEVSSGKKHVLITKKQIFTGKNIIIIGIIVGAAVISILLILKRKKK